MCKAKAQGSGALQGVIGLFLVAAILFAVVLAAAVFSSHYFVAISSRSDSSAILANILNSGGWAQALAAYVTTAITATVLWQIHELRTQNERERKRVENEAYRLLITDRMIAARRLLNSPEIEKLMEQLEENLRTYKAESKPKGAYKDLLQTTRLRFDKIAGRMKFPALARAASLEDVEMLLNECNYLSKLILDGYLSEEFATDMADRNLRNVRDLAAPYIDLRGRLSEDSYASHFVQYVDEAEAPRTCCDDASVGCCRSPTYFHCPFRQRAD